MEAGVALRAELTQLGIDVLMERVPLRLQVLEGGADE
jgi:hypothetical protein